MLKNIKGVATNAWKLGLKNMAQITTVIGLISAVLGLWWQIDKKLEESMMEQTQIIIKEMDVRTSWIAEFEKEDLFERIQVLELEVEDLERQGLHVPERKKFHLRSMKERYAELKDAWKETR